MLGFIKSDLCANFPSLCNLTIEMGSRSGFVAPDDTVIQWLAGRPFAPTGAQWDQAVAEWQMLKSDADARFDHDVTIDCSILGPQITWGTDPGQVVAVGGRVPDGAGLDAGRRAAACSRADACALYIDERSSARADLDAECLHGDQ